MGDDDEAGLAHHHSKHGVAAIVLGLALLAAAWISTGTKETATR